MEKEKKLEFMFIPSNLGMIKMYIYGFEQRGDSGEVVAILNEMVVKREGYSKRKTVLKTFIKLNRLLAQ